jgi:hypothetical protein
VFVFKVTRVRKMFIKFGSISLPLIQLISTAVLGQWTRVYPGSLSIPGRSSGTVHQTKEYIFIRGYSSGPEPFFSQLGIVDLTTNRYTSFATTLGLRMQIAYTSNTVSGDFLNYGGWTRGMIFYFTDSMFHMISYLLDYECT